MKKFLLKLTAMSLICTLFVGQRTHLTYGEEVAELKDNAVLKTEQLMKETGGSKADDELNVEQLKEENKKYKEACDKILTFVGLKMRNKKLKKELRKERLVENAFFLTKVLMVPTALVVSWLAVGMSTLGIARTFNGLYGKFGCRTCYTVNVFFAKFAGKIFGIPQD